MPYNPGDNILGKYKVEEWLGVGTFTDVYRVTSLGMREAHVLKVLREEAQLPGGATPEGFSDCFKREVKLVARLIASRSHANLIEVYDSDLIGSLPFLERDLAPGGSLAEKIQDARNRGKLLPLSDVVKMGLEVADGLSILHAREVVHRNLKPSNILFDALGTAKISDLYLAQVPAALSMELPQCQPLPLPGPVGYMSPEQASARHKLKPSSDVYSLGAVLFEALTGYNYKNLKPSTHVLELRSEIPEWLDELIAQMLSRSPDKRPWDGAVVAAKLRADLDRLAGEPKEVVQAEGEIKPLQAAPGAPKEFTYNPPGSQGSSSRLSGSFTISSEVAKSERSSVFQFVLDFLALLVRHPIILTVIAFLLLVALWFVLQFVYK